MYLFGLGHPLIWKQAQEPGGLCDPRPTDGSLGLYKLIYPEVSLSIFPQVRADGVLL